MGILSSSWREAAIVCLGPVGIKKKVVLEILAFVWKVWLERDAGNFKGWAWRYLPENFNFSLQGLTYCWLGVLLWSLMARVVQMVLLGFFCWLSCSLVGQLFLWLVFVVNILEFLAFLSFFF